MLKAHAAILSIDASLIFLAWLPLLGASDHHMHVNRLNLKLIVKPDCHAPSGETDYVKLNHKRTRNNPVSQVCPVADSHCCSALGGRVQPHATAQPQEKAPGL